MGMSGPRCRGKREELEERIWGRLVLIDVTACEAWEGDVLTMGGCEDGGIKSDDDGRKGRKGVCEGRKRGLREL